MWKNKESFNNFYKLNNNALLTVKESKDKIETLTENEIVVDCNLNWDGE